MSNKKLITLALFLSMILSVNCYAADLLEEETTPRSKRIYLDPQKSVIGKGKLNFILAVGAGYDNNSHLDSQREGDGYNQNFFRAAFVSPLSDQTNLVFDYEMMSLLYAGESDLDLIKNGIRGGVDHKLNETMILSSNISFDSIEFLKTGADDYLDSAINLKLQHKLPLRMFQTLSVEGLFRNFQKRNTRVTATTWTDKLRNDWRNTVGYEIGKYFEKDLLKLGFEYFYNNSNETYLKYYDYDSYKTGASFTHIFNDKIFGFLSCSHQYRDYRSRTIITGDSKQFERTILGSSGLFYKINDGLSLGLNYTYRQNYSNEPADRYSGSLVSVTSYYKF